MYETFFEAVTTTLESFKLNIEDAKNIIDIYVNSLNYLTNKELLKADLFDYLDSNFKVNENSAHFGVKLQEYSDLRCNELCFSDFATIVVREYPKYVRR